MPREMEWVLRAAPRRLLQAATALLALGLAACGRQAAPPDSPSLGDAPRAGGTLVIGVSTDISGVNQLLSATDSFTQSVLDLLFLRLFEEQPDFDRHPPTFRPELAESWTWSDDHLMLTLRLRPDAVWTDGEPVTAHDVEWTWRAQVDPEVAWSFADSKENIASVEAIDRQTVRVVFHHRSDSQLAQLNEGVILPRTVWSQKPFADWRRSADWFVENLVTSGPFRLESWRPQERITLERNDLYDGDELPYLDRVVFRIVPQKANQVGQLLAGELHLVDDIPPGDAPRIERSHRARLLSYLPRQYNFIAWNLARPPFDDPEVRRALTLAIDRQALVDSLWFGRARVATSPIISSVWAHNRELRPWPYDPAAARELLAAEGWKDHDGDGVIDRDGRPFSFELATNANSTLRVDASVLIQEQLRRIAVQARLRREEFNSLNARVLAHDFDALLGGWTIDTTLDLAYAFHGDAIDGGYNFGSFSHPEVDRLIDAAQVATDLTVKKELLSRIQTLLHEQQPYTFLWEPVRLTGLAVGLRDARPNALDPYFGLERWWLTPTD